MQTKIKNSSLNLERGLCELAKLPREQSVTTAVLTRLFGCASRTITRWRVKGTLPPAYTIGNAYAWSAGAIVDNLQKLQDEALRLQEQRGRRMTVATAGLNL